MDPLKLKDVSVNIDDPINPVPELIPGLLPANGQLVIAGETETGKSLIALEISHSLLTGEALWGGKEPVKRVSRVLYVLGEHYTGTIQGLWQNKLRLSVPVGSLRVIRPEKFPDRALVANGEKRIEPARSLLDWAIQHGINKESPGLLIFDPLAAFVRGVDAENDNVAMRHVLDMMTAITQELGAACLVLAHSGKPTIQPDGREIARGSYAIRGASATEDAATNIFYLSKWEPQKDGQEQPLDATLRSGLYRLRKRKYKGEAPDHYYLRRNPDTFRHSLLETNRPLVEARHKTYDDILRRFQMEYPDLSTNEAIRKLSKILNVSTDILGRRRH